MIKTENKNLLKNLKLILILSLTITFLHNFRLFAQNEIIPKSNYYLDSISIYHLKDTDSLLVLNNLKQVNTLGLYDFLEIVKYYHPISKSSKLINTLAENNLLKAKGGFDPKLFSYYEGKTFDKKNYFDISNSGISIPTYPGLDIKLGVETARGQFVDGQNTVPPNGLAYLGVTMPVGQGLFIDKRRNDLLKAELMTEAAEFDRQNAVNELLIDALYSYFDWIKSWKIIKVLEKAKNNALVRHRGIVQNYLVGDEPAIDTVETFIQFQTLELNYLNSINTYQNAILDLNNYLWFEDKPIVINFETIPDTTIHQDQVLDKEFLNYFNQIAGTNKDSLIVNHPEIMQYNYKIKSLNLDLELYEDRLKPQLNLKYNVLNEYLDWDGLNTQVGYLRNNYKAGLEFNFPIFLRKERGDIDATETKIKESELSLTNKILNLKNKITQELNNLQILKQNFVLSQQIRDNYGKLLNAEEVKFGLGESSIFLINSREIKLLESELKLIESDIKSALQYFKYLYVNGILYQL